MDPDEYDFYPDDAPPGDWGPDVEEAAEEAERLRPAFTIPAIEYSITVNAFYGNRDGPQPPSEPERAAREAADRSVLRGLAAQARAERRAGAAVVSAEDLRWMREHDEAARWLAQGVFDLETDAFDERHDDWERAADLTRMALGRELDRRNGLFWYRLRRLGPTPSLVVEANDTLTPAVRRPVRIVHVARPRTGRAFRHARPRGRRPSHRRRGRAAARAGPGDDGPSDPPGARGGWPGEVGSVAARERPRRIA